MKKNDERLYPELEKLKPLWELSEELDTEIQDRGLEPKYPTGLIELDGLIWGLHKKQIVTIGAVTGGGKTHFTIYLLTKLANRGARIVDFTLEMTEVELCERIMCNVCRLDSDLLRRGLLKKEYNEHKANFMSWAEDTNVLITNAYGRKFNEVLRVCEITQPDFVIIDYIQLIGCENFKDKKAAIDDFLIRIGDLSKDMNFGVINVSQLNREVASSDRPYKHHLMWSSVLEHHSHTILLLHHDFVKKDFYIFVEKQRHGRSGKVKVDYEPQFSNFGDIEWSSTLGKNN